MRYCVRKIVQPLHKLKCWLTVGVSLQEKKKSHEVYMDLGPHWRKMLSPSPSTFGASQELQVRSLLVSIYRLQPPSACGGLQEPLRNTWKRNIIKYLALRCHKFNLHRRDTFGGCDGGVREA
jgi:hypothetical protein